MKSHHTILIDRMVRAGLKSICRYRVVAAGIDHRNRIISIAVNSPRLLSRGWHAEEKIIHNSPRSLARIILVRCGADGRLLPIDPCNHCKKLANKRGIAIESV